MTHARLSADGKRGPPDDSWVADTRARAGRAAAKLRLQMAARLASRPGRGSAVPGPHDGAR